MKKFLFALLSILLSIVANAQTSGTFGITGADYTALGEMSNFGTSWNINTGTNQTVQLTIIYDLNTDDQIVVYECDNNFNRIEPPIGTYVSSTGMTGSVTLQSRTPNGKLVVDFGKGDLDAGGHTGFTVSYQVVTTVQTPPTDNVVAYYPFFGNAKDVTGKGMDCTVSGATLSSDRFGNANSAYFFDGVNDLIYMPTNLPFNNQAFCVSFWMKSSGNHPIADQGQTLIDFRGQYQVAVAYNQSNHPTTPNSITFYMYSSPNAVTVNTPNYYISPDTWYHVTANYGNNTMELYINGNLVGSKTCTPPGPVSGYNNTIGKDYNIYVDRSWVYGALDEILIYKRNLTSKEIKNLYTRSSSFNVFTEILAPIKFNYDNSGNRINRYTITLKSVAEIIQRDSIYNIEKDPGVFEDKLGDQTIIIYPNPTKGQLTVELKGSEKYTKTSLSLYDLFGKMLLNKKPLSEIFSIDLSIYPAGTYIMKIELGDKLSDWKIVKE